MTKNQARKIAKKITNAQVQQMFDNARENITDWTVVSNANISFTKGVAWNMLARGFDVNYNYHVVGITNMVWEFGDYLPDELKPPSPPPPTHHDPIFD